MLHKETVEKGTLALIRKLSRDEVFQDFKLVGGTALALQIGHRTSIDIDMFTGKPFDGNYVAEHLKKTYPVADIGAYQNNVACIINGVKISAIAHEYPDVSPPIVREGIRMASLDDIAAMKINAIYNLGNRYKDFLDVYHLLEHRTMDQMLKSYLTKYPEMSELTAKLALGHHEEVRQDYAANTVRKDLTWDQISSRIKTALEFPAQTFKRDRHRLKVEGSPNQSLRRRRGRSH